jgi:SAM-dependent methyltransferase
MSDLAAGYDAELQLHNVLFRRAAAVRVGDRVLDVGCGAGLTSRDAARAAAEGAVLGIDVSATAIERARQLARADNLHNVTFECADASTHPFVAGAFDRVISRYGTMFFGDPARAFGNIGRALRPGGPLVMMVWQSPERNEWATLVRDAIEESGASPAAFSLSDTGAVTSLLEGAGFIDVSFEAVDEPVYYGADVDAALRWVCGFSTVAAALEAQDPGGREGTVERLRAALGAHQGPGGVWLGARSWIVTARRH